MAPKNRSNTEEQIEFIPTSNIINNNQRARMTSENCNFFSGEQKRRWIGLKMFLLITVGVLSFSILTFVYYLHNDILSSKDSVAREIKPQVCNSTQCARTAKLIEEYIDPSVDPCENFHEYLFYQFLNDECEVLWKLMSNDIYRYACGKFIKKNMLNGNYYNTLEELSSRTATAVSDLLNKEIMQDDFWSDKQAKLFYRSCLAANSKDHLGMEPFLNLLEKLNLPRFPYFSNTHDTNLRNPIITAANLERLLKKNILFKMSAVPDPQNDAEFLLGLGPQSDILFQDIIGKMNKSERSAYSIQLMNIILSRFFRRDYSKLLNLGKISQTYELNVEIVDSASSISSVKDLDNEIILTLNELQNITDQYVIFNGKKPKVTWRHFFREYFQNSSDINLNKPISVSDIMYFKKIALILTKIDDSVLEALIWWRSLEYYLTEITPNTFVKGQLASSKIFTFCTAIAMTEFDQVVSRMFVKDIFNDNADYQAINKLIDNLKATLTQKILHADWLDKETKMHSLEKVLKLKVFLGFPKAMLNTTIDIFDNIYKKVKLDKHNFLNNMLQINKLINYEEISRIFSSSNRTSVAKTIMKQLNSSDSNNVSEWIMNPISINAGHVGVLNSIFIPAAVIQFPLYYLGLDSLNYGALGMFIAHEMAHGFDFTRRKYNEVGRKVRTWSNISNVRYEHKVKCFIDQYNNFQEDTRYVNGIRTLDENIADNVGLDLAYTALQNEINKDLKLVNFSKLTSKQLFFLSFAQAFCDGHSDSKFAKILALDEHTPSRFRVIGVLQNSKAFNEAWNCSKDSYMNTNKKCMLF